MRDLGGKLVNLLLEYAARESSKPKLNIPVQQFLEKKNKVMIFLKTNLQYKKKKKRIEEVPEKISVYQVS